jgi:protein TonB
MMVSLLPSPQPEMAQIIPTPKPVVQKPQPKIEKPIIEKVVQQPQPVPQTEAEQVVHQPPPPTEAKPNNSITPVAERSPVTEPKIEKVEEPKIEPPRFGVAYLKNPPPEYPLISRRLGEKGHVMLKVLVNAAGEAESVALETGSGSDRLDQAAIEAVKKWRFVPAKRNGQALSAYVLVPLNFGLSG